MTARGWIRHHCVALVALFVALAGTSYAAIAAKNSVSSRSILIGG